MSETYLNAHFGQINFHGELFATVHVRVVRLFERALELVQLERGERGAVAAVLFVVAAVGAGGAVVVGQRAVRGVAVARQGVEVVVGVAHGVARRSFGVVVAADEVVVVLAVVVLQQLVGVMHVHGVAE